MQVRFRKGQVLYPGKSTVVSELKYQALSEPSGSARSLAVKPRGPMGALAYADEWWKVGKILVRANHRNSSIMEVAYRARVVLGSVELEPKSGAVFVVGFEPLAEALGDRLGRDEEINLLRISHRVQLKNTFSCPVLVYAGYFSHDCAEAPEFPVATLIPRGTSDPFLLHILPDRVPSIPFTVTFSVATNVTEVTLRLYVVSGRMDASLPFSSEDAGGKEREGGGWGKGEGEGEEGEEGARGRLGAGSGDPGIGVGQRLPRAAPTRVLDFGMVQLGRTVTPHIQHLLPIPPGRPCPWLSLVLLPPRPACRCRLAPPPREFDSGTVGEALPGEFEVSEMVDWEGGVQAQRGLGRICRWC